jgi:hypothetical protein
MSSDTRTDLATIKNEEIVVEDPVVFRSPVTFTELIESPISPVPFGALIPSVLNRTRLLFNNSAPTLVTNFTHGQEGQEIKILGDGQTTLDFGASIKTNTGVDKLLLVNKVYTFTLFNNVWIENA